MSQPFAPIIQEVLEVERQEAERTGDETYSAPRPGASDEAIAAAEAARGVSFSQSYSELLQTCDGWDDFSWGTSLFGTKELIGDPYEEAVETLSYSEDNPTEIEQALIIGASDTDATLIMLVSTGEVVEFRYEEFDRHTDLAAYLLDRKTTLLHVRARAAQRVARTEQEWDPEFRRADDEELANELREALQNAPPLPLSNVDAVAGAPKTPAAADLILRDGDEIGASLDLGLVLYLGAAPTKDEVLETFRAFRRHFPFTGPLQWQLADAMCFSLTDSDDPDAEPFADALRVDDEGFYGLRVHGGGEGDGGEDEGHPYVLNIRGIPPTVDYDEEEETLERRASFVEVLVPVSEDPQALRALCHDLVEILPVRSGQGGYFAQVRDDDFEPEPWDAIFAWCRQFFGVQPSYIDGWLPGALRRHRGASWLTVLGLPFTQALGELKLSSAIDRHQGAHGVVLTAAELTLGDVTRGDFPNAIAEVARILDPVSLTSWSKKGTLSMGGVWFSTFADQLPGAFSDHHATVPFMRRFVDPAAFIGPSAHDVAMSLLDRLRQSMDTAALERWFKRTDLDDIDGFRDLMRALYNATCHTPDMVLRTEALEHAVRFPGWAPAQTYNNLLLAYFKAERMEDALNLIPVALQTAEDETSYTFHNAACVFAKAGRMDEAFDCVQRAKAADYPHMDKIESDDDLAGLRDRNDWRQLFSENS